MVATEIEQDVQVAEGGAEAGAAKLKAGVYVSTPTELRARLETEAQAAGKTPAVFVRDLLAERWGVTLPAPRTRAKYASDDERKKAQQTQIKTRYEAIKMLKQKYAAELEALMAVAKQGANGVAHAEGDGESGQATA